MKPGELPSATVMLVVPEKEGRTGGPVRAVTKKCPLARVKRRPAAVTSSSSKKYVVSASRAVSSASASSMASSHSPSVSVKNTPEPEFFASMGQPVSGL